MFNSTYNCGKNFQAHIIILNINKNVKKLLKIKWLYNYIYIFYYINPNILNILI